MRIDSNLTIQNNGSVNLSDVLSKLKIGDSIKAQIIEMTTNELVLKLFDGSTVNASLAAKMDAKPGDVVDLKVKDKNDNQLLLEQTKSPDSVDLPKTDSSFKAGVSNDEIKNKLVSIGVKPDDMNMEIAKELKASDMPINLENMDKMLDLVSKFSDIKTSGAAVLVSNNIVPEEKNIDLLKQLVDGKSQIGRQIDDLIDIFSGIDDDVISKIDNELVQYDQTKLSAYKNQTPNEKTATVSNTQNTQNDTAKQTVIKTSLNEDILKLFENETSGVKSSNIKNTLAALNIEDGLKDILQKKPDVSTLKDKISEFLTQKSSELEKLSLSEKPQVNEFLKNFSDKIEDYFGKRGNKLENFLEKLNSEPENKNLEKLLNNTKLLNYESIKKSYSESMMRSAKNNVNSTNTIVNDLINDENDIEFKQETKEQPKIPIISEHDNEKDDEGTKKVNANLSNRQNHENKKVDNTIKPDSDPRITENPKKNNALSKALESIFVKINSENLKDEINAKNLYNDMFNKLEIIKKNVESSTITNKTEILAKIDNLENNLKFINELNMHNTYIQIPLNMWGKNSTGELYILKRKTKNKKIDPESATMLISLDTQNIGRVDSIINVNKKNVAVNMKLEDKDVFDLIKENHKKLYDALAEKGYKLVDLKYRLKEENTNITNFKDIINKDINEKIRSIDYKI